jgi:hypothetical protein
MKIKCQSTLSDPKAGGCLAGIILIPLQIIYSIITIPIMLIVAIFAGIVKLFGGGAGSSTLASSSKSQSPATGSYQKEIRGTACDYQKKEATGKSNSDSGSWVAPQEIMDCFIKIREGMAMYLRHEIIQRNESVDEDAVSSVFEYLISGKSIPANKTETCKSMLAILKGNDDIFMPLKRALSVKSKFVARSGLYGGYCHFDAHVIGSGLQISEPTLGPQEFQSMAHRFYSDCEVKYGSGNLTISANKNS